MKKILKTTILTIIAGLVTLTLVNVNEYKFRLSPQAKVDMEKISGEFEETDSKPMHNNKEVSDEMYRAGSSFDSQIELIDSDDSEEENDIEKADEKRIEVDLTNQRVYAYEGDERIYNFVVSTGKFGRTPTGQFRIWIKLRYTRMTGGSKALGTYYDLPNVPYTMYFYNSQYPQIAGYALHGTYWHNNFGEPMSHGCVNLKTEDAEKLYYWANPDLKGYSSIRATTENPGTKVVIYGTAP